MSASSKCGRVIVNLYNLRKISCNCNGLTLRRNLTSSIVTAKTADAAITSAGTHLLSSTRKIQQILATPCRNYITVLSSTLQFRAMATAATNASFKLNEVEGDLFSAPKTCALAHCVGADFAMGAGIAVKFKQVYGQVDKLLGQGAKTGGVAVLKDDERYIYYLVTKPQSYGSPTYDSLRSSLLAMREHMRANNVQQLAIPRIGCGIDGLEWGKVSAELKGVFGDEKLAITVFNFVPK